MKMLRTFQNYKEALLDLIYPPNISCHICTKYLKGKGKLGICDECFNKIILITENCCTKCWRPLAKWYEEDLCEDCLRTEHFFHRAIAVVEYRGGIQRLVYRFKYHDATYLARVMATMMIDTFHREELMADIIMAVPLYLQKEKQRGYNQAHLLAKYISRDLGISYGKNNLVRIKNTGVMYDLSREERQKNVRDAFQLKNRDQITGKEILLVDDIFTTGATVNACSKVLVQAGARSVTVLAFARGV